MNHCHRVDVRLVHQVDVSEATQYLVHQLNCDSWHVACRQEHRLIVQLTCGSSARYAVCYECTPPVEKAIYHGSRAWELSIIPLHDEDNLREGKVKNITAGLAGLH
ncbi:MAG: hypothetical protein HY735_15450 [Verrucomicrobia bacterium]|nr:hypothetical protein [Verrucomicrobiota bacterium]